MKKGTSRFLAGILAAVLVFSSGADFVFARGIPTSIKSVIPNLGAEGQTEKEHTTAVSGSAATWLANQSIAAIEGSEIINGSIEVEIIAGVEVKKVQDFQVIVKNEKGEQQEKKVSLDASKEDSLSPAFVQAKFMDLEEGNYEIQILGDGYANYYQKIKVEGLHYKLKIYTGKVAYSNGDSGKPGLIVRGDLNGDRKLDKKDASDLVDKIEEKSKDPRYDLNGDGIVNLLDLNYLTEWLENGKSQTAEPELIIPSRAISGKAGDTTKLTGDMEQFLQGEAGITLAPENGLKISEDNPVELSFDFTRSKNPVNVEGIILQPQESGIITEGEITVLYGEENQIKKATISAPSGIRMLATSQNDGITAKWDENGILRIDLGGQIAVKLVTFRITSTTGKGNLAEISSVEFVNDMESKIPDPVMNIPANLQAIPGNKSFVLQWKAEMNVTGYEIKISYKGITETRKTTMNKIEVSSFNKEEMKNKEDYEVSVQSVNGEWRSGYSKPIIVTPVVTSVPDRPDYVTVKGGYRTIDIRWGKVKDADTFNVFYKEEGASAYTKVTGITGLSYQVTGLKDNTKYIAYVTATNEIGDSKKSLEAEDRTLNGLIEAKLPAYKLINTSKGEGVLSNHIKAATIGGGGIMVDSPLDKTTGSALGLFDNSYKSYVEREDWDYGGAYPDSVKGVTVELDQVYTLGMITLAEPIDIGSYYYVTVQYWDENGKKQKATKATIGQRTSGDRKYYIIKLNEPIKTSKLQIGVGRYGSTPWLVRISEIRFHTYDSLEQDIMDLYADDLHIVLKDSVTAEVIQKLQDRLNTKDTASGEFHPDRESLQKELDMAKLLLETELSDVVQVNPNITAEKDKGIAVGGMNSWQPLGVTAASGDQIVVYVGNPGMKAGASTNVQLVFTQQHAESSNFYKAVNLKIGRNEITLPKISSTIQEKGGALYVQYNGNKPTDQYAVRVSGGTKFPILNLYHVSEEEYGKRISSYVQELKAYVAELEKQHEKLHSTSENENVAYAYDAKNCILNVTDIQMDKVMISVPASQILAGLSGGNEEQKLLSAVQAMDGMLTLFYQHKGLTDSFAEGTDQVIIEKNHLPYRYLNIRYMKMFAGAFMYAAGNHIGIEWNETRGMVGSSPVVSDENGKYISGRYFGWGIAHEIGHEINQSAYAHAEVTNNYFSVLAQAKDRNDSVRFKYPEVFKKVTSGTWGYASNVFTQLGMYWQLHLAYDRDYNYKTYATYQEIFDHLFFARVDSYARNPESAPAPGNIMLALDSDRDQNLMRLASAAAEKNLTEFFTRWGMQPDAATLSYMEQFAEEKRAIYYVDDTARVYEIEHGTSASIAGKNVVTANASEKDSEVTITMNFTGNSEVLQGYEIVRVFTEQGEQRREVAGFTQENTFTDNAAFAANHVVIYEVTAIDKFMNRSSVCQTKEVKITGSGLHNKEHWSVSTNMASQDDSMVDSSENDPCEPTPVPAIDKVIDNSNATEFIGSADNADPYIVLELNQLTEVSALRYSYSSGGQAITSYKIEVSSDGENYNVVKEGNFTKGSGEIVYFENGKDPWVCTYDAAFVRLTAIGQSGKNISITELDLYGPSGDNVEFLEGGKNSIGKLQSEYVYDTNKNLKIPANSIIFTGVYKGNPAYNVVALYDENGKIVGGIDSTGALVAHQIILAPDPKDAMLGETSEGTWIYWIEPSDVSGVSLPNKVRAELYRVDNAITNEGQRMVSDTSFVAVPENLPTISINP